MKDSYLSICVFFPFKRFNMCGNLIILLLILLLAEWATFFDFIFSFHNFFLFLYTIFIMKVQWFFVQYTDTMPSFHLEKKMSVPTRLRILFCCCFFFNEKQKIKLEKMNLFSYIHHRRTCVFVYMDSAVDQCNGIDKRVLCTIVNYISWIW